MDQAQSSQKLSSRLWQLAGLAVVVICWGVIMAMYLHPAYDPMKFVCFARYSPIAEIAPVVIPDGWGDGYDGQAYYVMALGPTDIQTIDRYVGGAAYRYQRILLPLSAYLLSFGHRPVVHLVLIGLGFVLVFAGTWALMQWCVLRQVWWGWALIFPFFPGTIHSLMRITPDAPAAALAIIGAYLLVRQKPAWSTLFFCLAVLSKETIVLVPCGFFLAAVWDRDRSRIFWSAAPIVVLAVWLLIVRGLFGEFPSAPGSGNLGWPLGGIADGLHRAYELLGSADLRTVKLGAFNFLMLTLLIIMTGLLLADLFRSRYSRYTIPLILIAGLSLLLSGNVWKFEWSITRMILPVSLFLFAHALETRPTWTHKIVLLINLPLLFLMLNWMNLHF